MNRGAHLTLRLAAAAVIAVEALLPRTGPVLVKGVDAAPVAVAPPAPIAIAE
jgi:hypothetical protein